MKICVRAEWKPGVDALGERRARREREELREPVAQRRRDPDRAVGAPDADVDVEAERVVLPDDVAEDLVVAAVVRRVDDPLVLPVRPGVRARWRRARGRAARRGRRAATRRSAIVAGTSAKLSTRPVLISTSEAISSPARCRSTGVPAAAAWTSSKRLTRSSELGIEQRELLLDGDGEVGARVEALARVAEELIVWERAARRPWSGKG